jgi:DNA-binding CsgD family transcriptional regulator
MDSGQLSKAKTQLTQLLDEATEAGDLQAVAAHHLHLAQLEMWMGGFQRAVDHADESLLLHEYSDQPGAPRHVKAMSLACLGQLDRARQEAEVGMAEAKKSENVLLTIYNLHVLGFIELSLGNLAAAHPYLDRAIEQHRPRWNREFGDAHFVPDQVETLVALGRLDEAEDLVGWMEEVGAATGRPWTLATGARSRGILLAAQGRSEAADRALRVAIDHHLDLGMPFEEARTLLVHGVIQRRSKQRAKAAVTLNRARELFSGLGSSLWQAKAAAEQDRVGKRSQAQAALTPIEEQVAGLASLGHNNREIADLLFISRKTVEANLTHIYRKLGIRSRAQLGTALSSGSRRSPSK